MYKRQVKEQLAQSMDAFGLSIAQALLTDIVPAAKVKDAMNEVLVLRAPAEQSCLIFTVLPAKKHDLILRGSMSISRPAHTVSGMRCQVFW